MSVELKWVRIAFEIIGYLALLGVITMATYALWAGPELFGVSESWPLALYFVVPYLGTVLVAYGVFAAIRIFTWILNEAVA